MNIETGEIKKISELTEEEKKSGKWVELPGEMSKLQYPARGFDPPKSKSRSELKREEYMRRVAEKKRVGENV